MASFSRLLHFARMVVQNVCSQLTQQFNVVEDQAMNPLRRIIDQVVGGVWVGEGANAFVEELSQLMIPGVGRVMEDIDLMNRNVRHASEIIDEADRSVTSQVNALADVFGAIYH